MDLSYLEIKGGVPLCGEIEIQGSKNAVLPILAACMLGEGVCIIENCPFIGDVEDTLEIMKMLGCRAERDGRTVSIDASEVKAYEIGGTCAARIRSSVLFLGALLGRMKRAVIPLPGGCAIGARPVDLHLWALGCLGAEFTGRDRIIASAKRLHGSTVKLPLSSVGATENTILAAVQAEGDTLIENAAREPEVDELCEFLNQRGAEIARLEDNSICVRGGKRLKGVRYCMKADRIVTGSYLLAAAATGGRIRVRNDSCRNLQSLVRVLQQMGAEIDCRDGATVLSSDGRLFAVPYLATAPYPGFPTDLQSPMMAALCRAEGKSRICETVFENRFRTADELKKMGAKIEICGKCAVIDGVEKLRGALLAAPDLRGGAALVIAALQSQGCTTIRDMTYVDRGYESIERDMSLLGADIKRYR
ncbi:MAG: UDP-N-acetylglucosamine 1-carboxyvinyltransferase [Lachnospiraceae bacterium]|nr:UDP-N-acetylglucosamine 1-carboxyvinyltransferase [Lachnospiraceae bacterium]